MPSVFDYLDYRKYLRDYYLEKKETINRKKSRKFSFQKFADMAGFNTKTFLFKVIKNEKSLSKKSVFNVAEAIGFRKKETRYFEALVSFNEAKTLDERLYYFDTMKSVIPAGPRQVLRENQFDYFSNWHHHVIRELVCMFDFKDNWADIANAVYPRILPKKAKMSVQLLLDLGLLKKGANGRYVKTSNAVSTSDAIESILVQKINRDFFKIADKALDRFSGEQRDISGQVMGVSAEGARQMKEAIQHCRNRLRRIAENEKGADRVYLAHFQFFPLSQKPQRRRRRRKKNAPSPSGRPEQL